MFNVLLNRKMPFLLLMRPFMKWLQSLLRSKNTPLLLKELNVINYNLCTPLLLKDGVLNPHMK
jgi:hypothetical protein